MKKMNETSGSTSKDTYNVHHNVFHAWLHSITVNIAQLKLYIVHTVHFHSITHFLNQHMHLLV
jgi:hypothetical protein